MIDLSGKAAIVAGAARGISKSIAERLAEAGCEVAVADLLDINGGYVKPWRQQLDQTAARRIVITKRLAFRDHLRETEIVSSRERRYDL